MARELVSLTNRNEELQEHVLELPILENKYKVIDFSISFPRVKHYFLSGIRVQK